VAGVTSPVLWYIDRGSGLAALTLLTTAVVLGVVSVMRVYTPRWPRFALTLLHRNLALLALAFSVLHVLTAVVDSYVPIKLLDSVVPFEAAYRPFWLGLGTIGADLMLAVLVTTAVRRRLGYKAWRSVHLLSYGCWVMSMIHAIGIGSDARTAVWGIAVIAGCIGAAGAAFVQRTTPAHLH
jgi:methionine sulfoxide reductase heme-binding subunit